MKGDCRRPCILRDSVHEKIQCLKGFYLDGVFIYNGKFELKMSIERFIVNRLGHFIRRPLLITSVNGDGGLGTVYGGEGFTYLRKIFGKMDKRSGRRFKITNSIYPSNITISLINSSINSPVPQSASKYNTFSHGLSVQISSTLLYLVYDLSFSISI